MTKIFAETTRPEHVMWHVAACFWCAVALAGCALPERSDVIKTGNDEFVRYVLTPSYGPPVEYYISQPKTPVGGFANARKSGGDWSF